jgi:hypothetical protein
MWGSCRVFPCRTFVRAVFLVTLVFLPRCGDEKQGRLEEGERPDLVEARRLIEEAIERDAGSKVDVDLTEDGVRIRGRGDRRDYSFAAGGKIRLPDSLPWDVTLYPGAELQMAQELSVNDVNVVLLTKDGRDQVLDFYKNEAPAKGWRFTSEAGLEGEVFLGFVTEGKALTVAAAPGDTGTLVSISYKDAGL